MTTLSEHDIATPSVTHEPWDRTDDVATQIAMQRLRRFLDDVDYGDLYGVATDGALYASTIESARSRIESLRSTDRAIVRLFALASPVAIVDLPSDARLLVDLLRDCSLVSGTELVSTNGFVIVPTMRGYLLVGTPPPYGTSESIGASGYLGNDSLTLAAALPSVNGKRVLDLGAGSGIQGLLAAGGAKEAVLTDIDAASLELATCNGLLNDVGHRVRYVHGDGFAPFGEERFDIIVALPPYVPAVDGSGTSLVVCGGPDGLTMIRRFLREGTPHLEEGGVFVAFMQLFCDDDGPLLAKELDVLANGHEARLVLRDWSPLQPYVFELSSKLSEHGSAIGRSELQRRYNTSLRSHGITGVCSAVIRIRRPYPSETALPPHCVIGDAPAHRPSDVPILVDAELAGDDRLWWIRSATSAAIAINAPTAALVRAIDGRRNIMEIVAQAWSVGENGSPDYTDQALARLADLQRAGVVSVLRPR